VAQIHADNRTPGQPPIKRVLDLLPMARRAGNGWTARCPSHQDNTASLSVRVGADERVLLHCFAGCQPEVVLANLGLAWHDLFPSNSIERRRPRRWGDGITPLRADGRPALWSMGDPVVACWLAELARLAALRGAAEASVIAALIEIGEACGANPDDVIAEVARGLQEADAA
jgi:hypothetical protein